MRFNGTMRRGFTGTATAVAAMAALTASQAPGLAAGGADDMKNVASDDVVWTEVPNDDSYHTELPPLRSPEPPKGPGAGKKPGEAVAQSWAEAGIPATVLAAYRDARSALGRSDPGCHLPWQLLAAIGKVESGHARGGRVDSAGTTLTPILGPVLNGQGFADIRDTDGGAYDGDSRYDRAVGPMQFIPSTWAHWGKDGNGDGREDPNNIVDAALAAGHYLCAGTRDLSVRGDLDRAILSYNRSDTYLRTVLSWLDFYRKGAHAVADGEGVIPRSPGAGSPHAPKAPVGGPGSPSDPGKDGGGGIVVGPQPSGTPRPSTTPTAEPTPTDTGSPGPGGSPSPTDPGPDPTDSGSTDPTTTPDPTMSPDPTTTPDPTTSPDPDPTTSDPACPTPSAETAPDPTPSGEPCAPPAA
ncbi:lytic transglycosylase domain-containing protein [Streptomyces sp. NPDC002793]|uniref:lytic transglycosylase domain-containing protein n=1 Tax=Streptomyces sp. NPDC002793 TaxID=3154432 RepID=UPI00331676DE